MPSSMSSACVLASIGILCSIYYLLKNRSAGRLPLPPGPKGLPFFGNFFQFNPARIVYQYRDWAVEYGEIIHLSNMGRPIIVVNNAKIVKELEKRGAIYADRPRFVMYCELMGWDLSVLHMQYNDRFRKQRRLIHQVYGERSMPALRPIQDKQLFIMLGNVLEQPYHFDQHVRRFTSSLVLEITYGHKVMSLDDPLISLSEEATRLSFETANLSTALVDVFPLLKYLPEWLPFSPRRKAREGREATLRMFNEPFDTVQSSMRSGTATSCMVTTLLDEYSQQSISTDDENIIKGTAGILYSAVQDTTVPTIRSWLLAMVRHPEIFKKSQEEIDNVIGSPRLITLDDRKFFPYLECIIKETFRWNPAAPIGAPHAVTEDDTCNGYFIPKGATIIYNIYAMLQLEYDSPEEFRPERYIENPNLMDPRDVAFGFGRRICPGKHFADVNMWGLIANLTALFDIRPVTDENGKDIIPPAEFLRGPVSYPLPFKCKITPRSKEAANVVYQARASLGL